MDNWGVFEICGQGLYRRHSLSQILLCHMSIKLYLLSSHVMANDCDLLYVISIYLYFLKDFANFLKVCLFNRYLFD